MMTKTFQQQDGYLIKVAITLILSLIIYCYPAFIIDSLAAERQDVAKDALCNIINYVTGGAGKAVAAFAILFVGFGLFLGKVSWGLVIAVCLGVGAVFGAVAVIDFVTKTSGDTCTKTYVDIDSASSGGSNT